MNLSTKQRSAIRAIFGGRCAYCGCELGQRWHADHVEPVIRCYRYGEWRTNEDGSKSYIPGNRTVARLDNPNGERLDNFWPSCLPCNINKSSMSIEVWRKFLLDGPVSLSSYNARFKHMLRFGIVKVNPEPFLFWFERYRAAEAQA